MSERISLVELDLERCSLTYGSSPCEASIGVTGADKCFNCLATCQDKTNYTKEIVTTTYSYASGDLPRNIDAIPNIENIAFRPAKLELGESIGIRASVTVNFGDSRSPDTGPEGDRYLNDRNYDPYQRGTYWGKFRARYPYTKGANIRVLRGTSDQSKDQMEVRHFIVDKVAGPTSSGQFTIVCKDALKLLNGKQAQAPKFTEAELLNEITSTDTSITVDPIDAFDNIPTGGLINLGGNEICEYSFSGTQGVLNIVRAKNNTTAEDHKKGARVQWCLQYPYTTSASDPIASNYTVQRAVDIIRDLLINYAAVPEDYIPFNDWLTEDENNIKRFYSAIIAEPTSVQDLINELLQQTASTLWWDDSARKIRFRVLRGVSPTAATYTDDLIVGGSFSAKDQPEKRVSRVQTYYGQLNPLEKLDEKTNYSNSLATVSTESEANFGEPSIKSIFSRWIVQDNKDAADRLNKAILSRYSTPPRLLSFGMQRDQYGNLLAPELAGEYFVNSWTMQDATGASEDVPIQTVQVRTSDTGYSVMAEEVLYTETIAPEDPLNINYPIDTSQQNFNLYNVISASFPLESDTILNITIPETTIITSSNTNTPAFQIGNEWPTGMTINIVVGGTVVGKGGKGGRGGAAISTSSVQSGEAGEKGGEGLVIPPTCPAVVNITLLNDALIGGGGGGGGGGGAAVGLLQTGGTASISVSISGAGGGGGKEFGLGGLGGANSVPPSGFPNAMTSIVGKSGQAAGTTTGGSGGGINSEDMAREVRNGAGGNGGGIGQNGTTGQAGYAERGIQSSGGAGGLAGNAINKNGNTVTITNNGTIAGNIAP